MVGKTGAGKSALGNNLLQFKKFESVTTWCQFGTRTLDNGKKMVVVDTPGISDTKKNNVDTAKEIVRSIRLSAPGPHIFVFVLKIGRFTEEEMNTIQQLKDLFGEEVVNYVIIVFTGKDSLDYDSLTIDQYIENSPEELQSLVGQCQGTISINNRAKPPALANDVKALLDLMDEIVKKHDGGYYTGEMYEGAKRAFQENMRLREEEKNKKEREMERERKQLKKLVEDKKLKNDKWEEELERRKNEFDKNEREFKEEIKNLNIDARQEYQIDVERKDSLLVNIARCLEFILRGIIRLPAAQVRGVWNSFTSLFDK